MEKFRAIIQAYERWTKVEKYSQRIQTFLDNDFILAIENAKALIEAISKTILWKIEHAVNRK